MRRGAAGCIVGVISVFSTLAACGPDIIVDPPFGPEDGGFPGKAFIDEDSSVSDGSADAAIDAGDPLGGMIIVGDGGIEGGAFAIDALEVNGQAWNGFLAQHPTSAGLAVPARCANRTLGQHSGCVGANETAHVLSPQTCVDWCDAESFCIAAGKRLCGSTDAQTAIASDDDANDPTKDQWMRACSARGAWPYGADAQPTYCNTSESGRADLVSGGASFQCEGGVLGLFDMSGNAGEWEDACYGAGGNCNVRGGSYVTTADDSRCDSLLSVASDIVGKQIGFRCCKDL